MGVKRLFIASFIPQTLMEKHLDEIQKKFEGKINAKWVEPHNLHVSYKFLGNVNEENIPEIKKALRFYLQRYDHPIYFNSLECMPSIEKPRVLHTRIFSPDNKVVKIFNEIEKVMTRKFEYPNEKGRYKPHLSIARIKDTYPGFEETLAEFKDYKLGFVKYFRVNLVESNLNPIGPVYNIL